MSFFDDEPPTRQARPRRPAGPRSGGATSATRTRPAGGGGAGDPQQLMVRRAAALGIGALLLILIVLGFRGCLNSRTANALKDYNRSVGAIVADSNDQVSARLFELLAGGQSSTVADLEQNVNQVRVTADEDLKRARALDVPGDMQNAQFHLLEVLTLRADGVKQIAQDLPSIEGDQAEDAASRIAGQMSAFLASDVIYATRVAPFISEALANQDIAGQTTPASRFLPDAQWIDPAFVRRQLTGKGGGRGSGGTPAPGTHGHGLLGTAVGTTNLVAGTTNRVAGGSNPTFNVRFANQGENDEFDVAVKVSVSGGTGDPIEVQKAVDQTAAGAAEIVVPVPLGEAPPQGPVRVTVEIVPVPGEVNTDNNKATYTVIFS